MYLDVDVLYALLKERDFNKNYAERMVNEKGRKYTSTVALLELEIIVKRELGDSLSLGLFSWVKKAVPGISFIAFEERHFQKSLELREKYGFGIFDAVHAAVCLSEDKELASTDLIYDRVPGLKRVR